MKNPGAAVAHPTDGSIDSSGVSDRGGLGGRLRPASAAGVALGRSASPRPLVGRGPSASVLSWPSRPPAGALASATTRCAGARARLDHAADQGLAAGQLGDVLDLVGADHHAVDRAALDLGLLELLDLGARSPWPARPRPSPPQTATLGPSRNCEPGRRSPSRSKTRRASVFFTARIWIFFLRRSQPELVLGDRVQPLEVEDQHRRGARPGSVRSWSIIISLTYLLMIESGLSPARRGRRRGR